MGTYVIEHDAERMANGGPCTHIYKFDDRRLPVVAFHCVHLDRPANDGSKATVKQAFGKAAGDESTGGVASRLR